MSNLYESTKLRHLKTGAHRIPDGAIVTLSDGSECTAVEFDRTDTSPRIKTKAGTTRCVSWDEISKVSFSHPHNSFSPKTAVLSLSAATKAFGWIGGLVGAGVASTSVTVQNYMLGIPLGTTETTLASKMGMSVGSLALMSSWIGFAIGVAMTPFVYFVLRKKGISVEQSSVITVFVESDDPVEVSLSEITNATIAYTCVPSKPEIHQLASFPGSAKVLIDIPIPTVATSIFLLNAGGGNKRIVVEPFSVYLVTATHIRRL